MVGEGAVFGQEGGVEVVPHAPKEDVVGIGVGLSYRAYGTYDAGILTVAGHAQ